MAKKIRLKALILLGICTVFGACGCMSSRQPKYHPGGPYFYKSWASYVLPYRPIDEISETEAKDLERQGNAFYIAYFNDDGYIKSFEKRYQGKRAFKTDYFYEKGILKKQESIQDGKTKIIFYDNKGNIVKP